MPAAPLAPAQQPTRIPSLASLFKNPAVRAILLSTGNIPVDRKSKDRQVLFRGTFDVLARGAAVALFPEGTSYTEPAIMQVKDGAAWARWGSFARIGRPVAVRPPPTAQLFDP